MVATHIHSITSLPWTLQVAMYTYEIHFYCQYKIHVVWPLVDKNPISTSCSGGIWRVVGEGRRWWYH